MGNDDDAWLIKGSVGMDNRIEKIVILGGGAAGWMTASYLAKMLGGAASTTVIEAPSIPKVGKIGVGEATAPNLQPVFFDFFGITEQDWMPACNASFKMGIKLINWCTGGDGQPEARAMGNDLDYYHTFGLFPEHEGIPLSHYQGLLCTVEPEPRDGPAQPDPLQRRAQPQGMGEDHVRRRQTQAA